MDEQHVVLYVGQDGKEAITDPEPYAEANARAQGMVAAGIHVLSVVDPEYGRKRIDPARDTRVWYRQQGSGESEDGMFSALMTYPEATAAEERFRSSGYEVVGLISQQEFLERTGIAVEESFGPGEITEPGESLRRDETGAMTTVPDHHVESRRYQALELALKLMEQKKGTLSLLEMKGAGAAKQVVEDARAFEKYLKGTTPRVPKNGI